MSARPKFHVAAWLAGSLFGLLTANVLLILFVSGTDIFLGQPPQAMAPLFALLVASTAVVALRRSKARAPEVSSREVSERTSQRNRATTAPAYVAMTIIRRPYVEAAQAQEPNEWKGTVQ
jgi:hypothetical protein